MFIIYHSQGQEGDRGEMGDAGRQGAPVNNSFMNFFVFHSFFQFMVFSLLVERHDSILTFGTFFNCLLVNVVHYQRKSSN